MRRDTDIDLMPDSGNSFENQDLLSVAKNRFLFISESIKKKFKINQKIERL